LQMPQMDGVSAIAAIRKKFLLPAWSC
jgi:CheY-like chemotaxis protein